MASPACVEPLDFVSRIILAIVAPWRMLFDGVYAASVKQLDATDALPPADEPVIEATEQERDLTPALQLLTILQREGRFVDFIQEDLAGASDADIGAAARVVHEGCRRGLSDYVDVAAIRSEEEGDDVKLEAGFDAARTKVTGNVVGDPPYNGKLAHHGWAVEKIRLPDLAEGHDPSIVTPAEVEL